MEQVYTQKQLESIISTIMANQKKQSFLTFEQYSSHWLIQKRPLIDPNTYGKYLYFSKALIAELGNCILVDISREDVQDVINHLSDRYKQSSVRGYKALLASMFRTAEADGYISHNPCNGIQLRRKPRAHKRPATQEEIKALIKTSSSHRLALSIPLLVYTGMRRGELLALQWSDVDLTNRLIKINKSVVVDSLTGRAVVKHTKTINSDRTIPICNKLYEYLLTADKTRKYVLSQSKSERPVHPQVFLRMFNHWKYDAGVSDITIHSLRHSFATETLKAGVNVEALRQMLGHADSNITLCTYCFEPEMSDENRKQIIAVADTLSF